MPSRSLPARPNLAQLKIQANELHRTYREGSPAAAARIAAQLSRRGNRSPRVELDKQLTLADAQLVIAREYGFENWTRLKHHVLTASRVARFQPHPRFDEAVAALDAGDLERLRGLIAEEPALVHARTNLEPPYDYFTGATLLHHVAGNPDRGRLSGKLDPLPKNIVEVARLLIDSGADLNAATLGPNGGTTMELLVTSKQASDASVSGPLIDLLLEHGATLDLEKPGALDAPLANHAPRAAERMIELGARVDVLAAAAPGTNGPASCSIRQQGKAAVVPSPPWHGDDRARCDRAGDALCLRPRAKRSRRFSAREGRQLEHDRRQQRHGTPPRRGEWRPRDGPASRGEGCRRQRPEQSVLRHAVFVGRPQQANRGLPVDASALRHRSARCGLLRSTRSSNGATSRRSSVGRHASSITGTFPTARRYTGPRSWTARSWRSSSWRTAPIPTSWLATDARPSILPNRHMQSTSRG